MAGGGGENWAVPILHYTRATINKLPDHMFEPCEFCCCSRLLLVLPPSDACPYKGAFRYPIGALYVCSTHPSFIDRHFTPPFLKGGLVGFLRVAAAGGSLNWQNRDFKGDQKSGRFRSLHGEEEEEEPSNKLVLAHTR